MSAGRVLRAAIAAAAASAMGLFGADAEAVPACGGQTHQNVCGGANIYPCCFPSNGNCTWWAWEAACRNWHIAFPNWGNANTWGGNAKLNPNVDVIGYPLPGSIATSTKGAKGHVAWVESVNGGSIVVSEEACHSNGSPGGYEIDTYSSGYFNSGYVVLKGAACPCSDGDTQTESCSCGTRTRTCNACKWGDWSACKGPPEVCDGVDNDCNGQVDEGHPQEFGPVLPDHAATLVDISYPQTLRAGERGVVWADFRNTGAKAWPAGGMWLGARGAGSGEASALFTPGAWPAWNVASALEGPVEPGDIARFAFEVTAPDEPGLEIFETFQLQVPGGAFLTCPTPDVSPRIRVLPGAAGAGRAGGEGGAAPAAKTPARGCAQAQGNAGAAGGAALALALVVLARSRRAGTKRQRQPHVASRG